MWGSVPADPHTSLDDRAPLTHDQRAMASELHDLPIAELSRLIAARQVSPVELVEALIQRVEQYDAQTARLHHAAPSTWRGGRRARPRPRSAPAGRAGRCTGSRSPSRTSTTRAASSRPATRACSSTGSPGKTPRRHASSTRRAPCCSASSPRTRWRTPARRSICRGRPRATRGTSRTSPAAPRRARAPPWRPAWCRSRSARTPVARSAVRRRSAASSASCRPSAW